jgi:acyl-CoA reductase-like NAD-dependent aldehyde dehydrogenase
LDLPFAHLEPYGVIGVIYAWNWPVLNAMRAVLPAIVAGNAVVLKPSEFAPLSALLQRELAIEAGWPEDIFLVATGAGNTGRALVAGWDAMAPAAPSSLAPRPSSLSERLRS